MSQATSADAECKFRNDVLVGLSRERKSIPSKYLYDQRGSQLFDAICELDEYYLTRTELAIMQEHAESIADQIGEQVMLVEYGSGSSLKTRCLLDSLKQPAAYVPVDISEEHLLQTAESLQIAYPEMDVLPVVADFTEPLRLPYCDRDYSHVAVYFPGSTIGNFTDEQAGQLLQTMSRSLGPQGGLLIGIDLQKNNDVIQRAYDDEQGITSEFSLNLLRRINDELGGNFDLDQFYHRAIYNDDDHRVEISLVSRCKQCVTVDGKHHWFKAGESIHTEYSHKYTVHGFAAFCQPYGFELHRHWTDDDQKFAVLHLVLSDNLA